MKKKNKQLLHSKTEVIKLTPGMAKELQAAADRAGVTKAFVVREALQYWLQRHRL